MNKQRHPILSLALASAMILELILGAFAAPMAAAHAAPVAMAVSRASLPRATQPLATAPSATTPLSAVAIGHRQTYTETLYAPLIMRSYVRPPIAASFWADPTVGYAPLEIVLQNASWGDIDSTRWKYGDGLTSTVSTLTHTHTYPTPGSYTVALHVSGPEGSDVLTRTNYIQVLDPAAGEGRFWWDDDYAYRRKLLLTPDTPILASETLTPVITVEIVSAALIDAGDLQRDGDDMRVLHWDGDDWRELARDIAAPVSPTLSIRFAVQEDLTETSDRYYLTYGNPSATAAPQLLPTTTSGRRRSATAIADGATISATVAIEGQPLVGVAPLTVTLQDASVPPLDEWRWDFGDGLTSALQAPNHVYATPGTYAVTLTTSISREESTPPDHWHWRSITTTDGLPSAHVIAVATDAAGNGWAITDGGLSVVSSDLQRVTTLAASQGAHDLLVASDERVWLALEASAGGGLRVLHTGGTPFDPGDDVWHTVSITQGLCGDEVTAMVEDAAGRVWFGTSGQGACVWLGDAGSPHDYSDDAWQQFEYGSGLLSDGVVAADVDPDEDVWFLHATGLSLLDYGDTPTNTADDHITALDLPGGDSPIYQAMETDSQANAWIGSSDSGLLRIQKGTPVPTIPLTVTAYAAGNQGPAGDDVRTIAIADQDDAWFGLAGGSSPLSKRLSGGGWLNYSEADVGDADVVDMATGADGMLWLAHPNDAGLTVRFAQATTETLQATASAVFSDCVHVVGIDRSADVGVTLDTVETAQVKETLETSDTTSRTVTSADGHVMVVFPPAALSEPLVVTHTPLIPLTALGHEVARFDIQAARPDGTPVTSFPAPVSIVASYNHLDLSPEAEQQIEAAVWDADLERWQPVSVSVNTENDLVTVTTDHFSRYAIFAPGQRTSTTPLALPPFDTSLFLGSATAQLPLYVAPGTGGMEPSLVLRYDSALAGSHRGSSQRTDEMSGRGWTLEEAGSIYPVHFAEPTPGPQSNLDEIDFQLHLHGTSYQLIAASDWKPQGEGGARTLLRVFRTEPETFWRVELWEGGANGTNHLANGGDVDSPYWRVTTPDGRDHYFGFGLDSGGGAAHSTEYWRVGTWDQGVILRYRIDRVIDTNGNCMDHSYETEVDNLSYMQYPQQAMVVWSRLASIDYTCFDADRDPATAASESTRRSVIFDYQPRPDAPEIEMRNHWLYAPIQFQETIVDSVTMAVDGQPFLQYDLSYGEIGGSGHIPYLKRIEVLGRDGGDWHTLPAIGEFDYYDSPREKAGLLRSVSNGYGSETLFEYEPVFGGDIFSLFESYLASWIIPPPVRVSRRTVSYNDIWPQPSQVSASESYQYVFPEDYEDERLDVIVRRADNTTAVHVQFSTAAHTVGRELGRELTYSDSLWRLGDLQNLNDGSPSQRQVTTYSTAPTCSLAEYVAYAPQEDVHFVTPAATEVSIPDSDARMRTEFSFDCGNLTEQEQVLVSGGSHQSQGRTTYEYARNGSRWILDRVARERALAPDGQTVAQTEVSYDGGGLFDPPSEGNATRVATIDVDSGHPVATSYAHDHHGAVIRITDALGHMTQIDHDALGFPNRTITPMGLETEQTVDARWGVVTHRTGFNDESTSSQYDAFGRLTQVQGPAPGFLRTITYNDHSHGLEIVDSVEGGSGGPGLASISQHNGIGQLMRSITLGTDSSDQRTIDRAYDALGRLKGVSLPYGPGTPAYAYGDIGWTMYEYDILSRVRRTQRPDGTTVSHRYGAQGYDGGLWQVVKTKDPAGRVAIRMGRTSARSDGGGGTIAFVSGSDPGDTLDWPSAAPDAADAGRWMRTTSDALGNVTCLEDREGNLTLFTYDGLGRRTSATMPDARSWQYAYNDIGQLTSQEDAKGVRICPYYDAEGRLVGKLTTWAGTCPTSPTSEEYDIIHIYDENGHGAGLGQRTSTQDATGIVTWTYDMAGNIVQQTRTITGVEHRQAFAQRAYTYTTDLVYDALGRSTEVTWPDDETLTSEYDAYGRLVRLSSSLNSQVYVGNVEYGVLGEPRALTLGPAGSPIATLSLDYYETGPGAMLRLSEISLSGVVGGALEMSYAYEADGQVSSNQGTVGSEAIDYSFGYDTPGHLETVSGLPAPADYAYDTIDNLTTIDGETVTFANPEPHQITSFGELEYDYDANGNRTREEHGWETKRRLRYDMWNRLTSVERSDGESDILSTYPLSQVLMSYGGDGTQVVRTTVNDVENADQVHRVGYGYETRYEWTEAITLTSTGTGQKRFLDLAQDDNGTLHLVWVETVGSWWGWGDTDPATVYYASRSPGADTWSAPQEIAETRAMASDWTGLEVASDGAGQLQVAWSTCGEGDEGCAISTRHGGGGGWSATATFSDGLESDPGIALAATSSGDIVLAWERNALVEGEWESEINAARWNGGDWTAEALPVLSTTLDFTTPDWYLEMEADSTGTLYLVYAQPSDWGYSSLKLLRRGAGGAWGATGELISDAVWDEPLSGMATDSQGDLHIVWNGSGVETRERRIGGVWGPSRGLAMVTIDEPPSVVVDENGDVQWTSVERIDRDCSEYYAVARVWWHDVNVARRPDLLGYSNAVLAELPDGRLITVWAGQPEQSPHLREATYDLEGVATARYDVGTHATVTRIDEEIYYLLHDRLGSTRTALDSDGEVLGHVAYTPYGAIFSSTLPVTVTDRLFTGQRWDAAAGLYDYGGRWYDPQTGTFVQPDPLDTSLNPYAYVSGNPANMVDPTGYSGISLVGDLLDVYETAKSGYRLLRNPSWQKAKVFGRDLGLAVLPIVTVGMVKAAARAGDAAASGRRAYVWGGAIWADRSGSGIDFFMDLARKYDEVHIVDSDPYGVRFDSMKKAFRQEFGEDIFSRIHFHSRCASDVPVIGPADVWIHFPDWDVGEDIVNTLRATEGADVRIIMATDFDISSPSHDVPGLVLSRDVGRVAGRMREAGFEPLIAEFPRGNLLVNVPDVGRFHVRSGYEQGSSSWLLYWRK